MAIPQQYLDANRFTDSYEWHEPIKTQVGSGGEIYVQNLETGQWEPARVVWQFDPEVNYNKQILLPDSVARQFAPDAEWASQRNGTSGLVDKAGDFMNEHGGSVVAAVAALNGMPMPWSSGAGAGGFDPTAVDAFGTGGSEFLGAEGAMGAGAAGASAFDPLAERLFPSFAEQAGAPISSITPVANSLGDKLAQLGIPGAQKLFGSAGDAAARIAAGAAGAGGAKKLKDMFSTGKEQSLTGDGDYQFPWEDVIGAVGEAYGANEYQKGLLDVMNKAVDRADPFASQRPGWQTEFNKMRDDPDYWSGNGVFGNIVNTAQDSSARKLASQGYNMSGNFATGVNKAGVTAAMPYANDYMKIVGNAAGANIDPGNAGNIMSTMGTASAGAGKELAGAIGYGAQSVMNGRQPSGLDQLFGTNKNKTLFNAINWGLS